MRFVLDGEEFELTADQVRSRLRGHLPENIQEHWVDVDGLRWPVKQALSIATGASKRRFVSQTAQRHLRNLGFTTSCEGEARSTVGRASRTVRVLDLATLPELDSVAVSVSFCWRDAGQVRLDGEKLPAFPQLPRMPGLYRFTFHPLRADVPSTVYIGESVDLARRGSNYRNARTDRSRQRTSRRIHKELLAHLSAGGRIDIAIAVEVALEGEAGSIDLRWKSARRLAENAAVLLAQLNGSLNVLNIDVDLGAEGIEE